jgi:hypothetical protein
VSVNPEKERAAQRGRALELRMAGATYAQIAELVGYSGKSAAFEAVKRALEDRAEQVGPMHPAVALELARLDTLLGVFYPAARRGDLGAGRLCHRLGERRTQLVLMHGQANPGAEGDPTPPPPDPEEVGNVVRLLDRYASGGRPGAPSP